MQFILLRSRVQINNMRCRIFFTKHFLLFADYERLLMIVEIILVVICSTWLALNMLRSDISQCRIVRIEWSRRSLRTWDIVTRFHRHKSSMLYRHDGMAQIIFAPLARMHSYIAATYRVARSLSWQEAAAIHGITCSRVVIATLHKHGLTSCRGSTDAKALYIVDYYPSTLININLGRPLCLRFIRVIMLKIRSSRWISNFYFNANFQMFNLYLL
jgi:hypothetical protein